MLDPSFEDTVCSPPVTPQVQEQDSLSNHVVSEPLGAMPSWEDVLATPSDNHASPYVLRGTFQPESILPVSGRSSDENMWDLRYAASLHLPQTKVRKPKAGNEIEPSELRPPVSASHWPFLWVTPHSLALQKKLDAEIPQQFLQSKIFQKLALSVVPGTLSTYAAGPLRFTQFCDTYGVPESCRMPASASLLAAFIANASGTGSGSMVKNWVNGLAFWHMVNRAEWHGKAEWIPKILHTAVLEGEAYKRPPRGPVTVEHLRALKKTLSLQEPRDAAIWAAATCAFWGCRRLGELLPVSVKKFDRRYHVARGTRLSRSSTAGHRTIVFHIPWTKTTTIAGGSVYLTATLDGLCPVSALENHFRVNSQANSTTPMFAYRDGRKWSILTKADFLGLTTKVYQNAMLEHVFGHSYRIGGSLRLLLDGVEPEVIMKIGGWSSLCFLIYWRRLEKVIPLALSRAWAKKISDFADRNDLSEDLDALVI